MLKNCDQKLAKNDKRKAFFNNFKKRQIKFKQKCYIKKIFQIYKI